MKKFLLIILITWTCIANAQTFSWSGTSYIYDNQIDTIVIPVTGLPSVIDISYGIAHICMDITHTYKGDLFIKLVSPDGTSVTLIDDIGGSSDNYTGTCVGMDGTFFSNSTPPHTGIFQPVGDVSSFNNNQNPNGDWLFIITDQASADTGTVHFVSLAFTNNPPVASLDFNSISEPTGPTECPSCVCPGGATDCDLLPDMTASYKEIFENHNEDPGFLYLSNATPNIGYGPMEIWGYDSCFCGTTYVPCNTICPPGQDLKHTVKQRVYHKVNGSSTLTYYDRIAGLMTYHASHGHLHVDNWADYTLRTATANPDATTWPIVGTGTKQSFCLINLGTCPGNVGECADMNNNPITTVPNQGLGFHTGCQLNQGIFVGNYDVYSIGLNDPIPLNNVCNGTYYIVSITDPNNDFLESDETNNWVAVPITLTQQNVAPSITPGGPTTFCQGGSVTLTSNTASNYLWSTGETTQSIVVNSTGSYTVSSDCGASTSTSSPVSVTVSQIDYSASANPAAVACNGGPVQLTATVNSPGNQIIPVTFTSNQVVSIPDNNSTGVTSSIIVSGINPASLSTSTIVSVKLNLTHTYDGDLAISLISPSGNSIYLSNRRGGGGDNFINTVFSMSATTLIGAGSAPFTGSYKPDGNFASLMGNVNGTWLLKVQDLAGVDVGTINNWNIILNNEFPGTYSYLWSSTPPGFSSTLQNPIANPVVTTTYNLQITEDGTGCLATQSIPVTVASLTTYYADSDGDGYGVTANTQQLCTPSGIYSATAGGDCNDNNLNVNPGITETCNGIDDNCNNQTDENCNLITLNLKVFIEGYYIGTREMQPALLNSLMTLDPAVCDTIIVELFEAISPYTKIASIQTMLYTDGNATALFQSSILNNSYYIGIRHRNASETWSKTPMLFDSAIKSFDFTTP